MSAEVPPRDHRRLLAKAYGLDPGSAPGERPKRVEPRRYRPIARPRKGQPMPDAAPRLKLVGTEAEPRRLQRFSSDQPLRGATDPRWVLAVRTSEQLQGAILPPEARARLLRLGRLLGLTPFDCSLVIAVVQDQARRGYAPADCPAAGAQQLQMIPLRTAGSVIASLKRINLWQLTTILGSVIAFELLVLYLFFG